MKIVVCIKQVPDTSDIKWTENNTIVREGVESVINPFDEYALETALRIKDKLPNTTITAITMGPPQAKDVLKRAVAMGVDNGILITDRKFAGADTIATSRTLAAAIKQIIKDFDLIICGQLAVDGDTAQTGPSIAQHLDLAQLTYVKEVLECNESVLKAKRETEYGAEILEMQLPGVICTIKCDFNPRKPLIRGFMKASRADYLSYSMEDIGLQPEQVGMKGSPTYVSRAFRPETTRTVEFINGENTEQTVDLLLKKLNYKQTVGCGDNKND